MVSNLEDGCIRVLVDGHYGLGVLHTCKVLDGTRDANSNVKVGSNDLASLSNLQHQEQSGNGQDCSFSIFLLLLTF